MKEAAKKWTSTEEYIASFPAKTKRILKEVRKAISQAAPGAEEVISYNMPAFKLQGMLVWFAAYKEHIGLYPRPTAIQAFKKELAAYEQSKGAIRFPLDEPMPLKLIADIVKYRVKENELLAKAKAKK